MDNEYIILIDENGSPYLSHAWGKREDHKYKLRVDNYYGQGKHLYLYTDKEVAAFQKNGGKRNFVQRLQDRARDKLGWDERSELESAGKNTKERAVKQQIYNTTLLGRAENLKNQASARGRAAKDIIQKRGRDTMANVKTTAKNTAKWLDDHDAGITETARYALKRNKVDQEEKNRLHDEMTATKVGGTVSKFTDKQKVKDSAKSALRKGVKAIDDIGLDEARRYYTNKDPSESGKNKLESEYRNTPAGKLDANLRKTASNVGKSVADAANTVGTTAKNAATNAIIKGKNVRIYYPSAVKSMTVEELITASNAVLGSAATTSLQFANTAYNNAVTQMNNAVGAKKEYWKEKVDEAAKELEARKKSAITTYNKAVDQYLKIKED